MEQVIWIDNSIYSIKKSLENIEVGKVLLFIILRGNLLFKPINPFGIDCIGYIILVSLLLILFNLILNN